MEKSIWNGFERLDFTFEEQPAILVLPHQPDKYKNWLFKTEYFGAFPELELQMLERGFAVAHVRNSTRWCKPEDTERQARFAAFLHTEYQLAEKCTPVGMSCGGMQAVYLAAKHPELVYAVYLDAPVINLLSCPAGIGQASDSMWPEFEAAMGISLSELIGFRQHPLDYIPAMIQHHIPVFLVAGDSDTTVPFCENGALLQALYEKAGAPVTAIVKPGCDHHPHGLEDNAPLIQFILQHSNKC